MKKLFTLGKDIVEITEDSNNYIVKILTPDSSRTRINAITKYLFDEGFVTKGCHITFHSKIIK